MVMMKLVKMLWGALLEGMSVGLGFLLFQIMSIGFIMFFAAIIIFSFPWRLKEIKIPHSISKIGKIDSHPKPRRTPLS
jgi:hypothetical protein